MFLIDSVVQHCTGIRVAGSTMRSSAKNFAKFQSNPAGPAKKIPTYQLSNMIAQSKDIIRKKWKSDDTMFELMRHLIHDVKETGTV